MAEIQAPQLGEAVRRRFHLAGESRSPSELSDSIVATVVLENDRPEYHALYGGRIASGRASQGATAGVYSYTQLFNPAGSGVIAVCECINVQVTADPFIMRQAVAIGSAVTSIGFRDFRFPVQAPTCQVREGQDAASIGTIIGQPTFNVLSGTTLYGVWPHAIILAPGTGIGVRTNGTNLSIFGAFVWRERAADPFELQLGV